MKKIMCLFMLSSLPAFAGMEFKSFIIGEGGDLTQQFGFVAKQEQYARLSIISAGIGSEENTDALKTALTTDKRFAFGSAADSSSVAEDFSIKLAGIDASSYKNEVCGVGQDSADSISKHILAADETWNSNIDNGLSQTLNSSEFDCSVGTAPNYSVQQTSAYILVAETAGGATLDLQVQLTNGVDVDLNSDPDKAFNSMSLLVHSNNDPGFLDQTITDNAVTIAAMEHGHSVFVKQSIEFDLKGPYAKPESRAATEFVAYLTP